MVDQSHKTAWITGASSGIGEALAKAFVASGGHAVLMYWENPLEPQDAANRDRKADLAHLGALLTRAGAPQPPAGVTHHAAQIGRHALKWESHTEFTTFLAHSSGLSPRAFDPAEAEVFPSSWIAAAPGGRLAALQVRIEVMPEDPAEIGKKLSEWFVPESLACARVLDGAAIIAGDFRIDPSGQMRFGNDPERFAALWEGAAAAVKRLPDGVTGVAPHSLRAVTAEELAALLDAQGMDANQMATAVNGEFVARELRAQHRLQAGDTVLTFQAIVGG